MPRPVECPIDFRYVLDHPYSVEGLLRKFLNPFGQLNLKFMYKTQVNAFVVEQAFLSEQDVQLSFDRRFITDQLVCPFDQYVAVR